MRRNPPPGPPPPALVLPRVVPTAETGHIVGMGLPDMVGPLHRTGAIGDETPVAPLVQHGSRLVIAHRGTAGQRPENTIVAFDRAVELGSDGIEMDVRVTDDDVPVIVHDPSTGRIGDADVAIEANPLAAVQRVDAGFRFTTDGGLSHPWRGKGVIVPTLAEVLERFPSTPILLELKSARRQQAVRTVLDSYGAWNRVVVASSLHGALRVFRDGRYYRSASRREIGWWYFGSALGLWPGPPGYQVLSIPERKGPLELLARHAVAAARQAGIPIHVWTIDEPATARRLWQAGATGIITNVPDRIIAVRSETNTA